MQKQPNRNYLSNDVVMTPEPLARELVEALNPYGVVLEPCAGDGAFVRAVTDYMGDDADVVACEIALGRDFFAWSTPVDWVITNPPWSQFAKFLSHSLRLANNVAMLVTVNHWFTKARVRNVLNGGFGYRRLILVDWPEQFPPSGFQLGMMHVQRGYRGPMDVIDLRIVTVQALIE